MSEEDSKNNSNNSNDSNGLTVKKIIRDNADSEKKPLGKPVLTVKCVKSVNVNNINNINNINTLTPKIIIDFYNNKENKLKIASSLYPDKKLTYSAIAQNVKLDYNVVATTIIRHKEDFFETNSIQGKSVIYLKPQAKILLENQYFEHERQQEETKQLVKREEERQSRKSTLNREINLFIQDSEKVQLSLAENKTFLIIDVKELMQYNPDIVQELLDNSEDVIAVFNHLLGNYKNGKIQVGFIHLPESAFVPLNDLRAKHVNHLFSTRGLVKAKTKIQPKIKKAIFECPSCGHTLKISALGEKLQHPTRCGCGRKGKFRLIDKEIEDFQILQLETLSEDLNFNQEPAVHTLLLEGELLNPENVRLLSYGSRISVIGLFKISEDNEKVVTNFAVEVSTFNLLDEDVNLLNPSEEELKKIQKIAKDNPIDYLSKQIFQGFYGYETYNKVLILQQFSGYRTTDRKANHVLIVGDPGVAKSDRMDRMQKYSPRSKRSSGSTASGVGLTVSVQKNEVVGDWVAEAGVLPQCHMGTAFIDELDKMSLEDRKKLHDAMESQFVTTDKANIHARFPCDTKVCATANPKGDVFDLDYSEIRKQLEETFPKTILDRFDFILVVRDKIDTDSDRKIARKIMDRDGKELPLEPQFVKKYILQANRIIPDLSEELKAVMEKFYADIRQSQLTTEKHQHVKGFTPRSLQAVIRLSEAFARARLSKHVSINDVQSAIQIYKQIYQISIL